MKILVLTSRLPYPIEKGDKLRVYYQIRELAQRHEVYLFSLCPDPFTENDVDHLRSFCKEIKYEKLDKAGIAWNLFKGLLLGEPLQAAYFYRSGIHQKLKAWQKEIQAEAVFCQLIRMAAYVDDLGIPAYLDYMDSFSTGMARQAQEEKWWLKPFFQRESRLLDKYQKKVYKDFGLHTIISAQDKALMDPHDELDIQIAPNGIDTSHFLPREKGSPAYDLAFVGNMGYFPNVKAAEYLYHKIMPLVWAKRPETTLLLAGARPHPSVQKMASDNRITISGWVDDIRDAYGDGNIFVAPIFTGSGQQNKILESMSMAVCCLTTPLVNNAIEAQEGEEIALANDPEGFAEKILSLLNRPEERQLMGDKARSFVSGQYTWAQSVAPFEEWLAPIQQELSEKRKLG
ncbi:MAG: glycosyltransferase [Bacteroidota bacterium]